ncbi:MAG TPA: tol-pal system protein YbgF [Terriglobales bacterium]|nr:tol-pal system protein YbgF [Terriglobales bacterium]
MKRATLSLALLLSLALAAAPPAFGVAKEIIQLQTQVQALQDQMNQMQAAFNQQMGVLQHLVEQSTDNMNKVNSSVADLQKALNQQHTDAGARADQLSGQIQALNDSLDELKARVTQLGKKVDDIQAAQTNLPSNPQAVPGQPGETGQPGQPQAQPAPPPLPPDVLYNNALRDFNSGKYDLATQEFQDYLKAYPTTDLAGNAQFYLAEMEYKQGNLEQAVADYDKVMEQYPGGNKTPAAQLKKGFALLDLGRTNDGTKELQSLIVRYPRSLEATQARDRLRRLGPTSSTRAKRR